MPQPQGMQGPNLDAAPAQPPSLSGPQAAMPGALGQGPAAPGSAVLQSAVSAAMSIESGLQDLASILPDFAPIAEQLVQVLRMGVARSLQTAASGNIGAGAPPTAPGQPPGPGMGAGTPSSMALPPGPM